MNGAELADRGGAHGRPTSALDGAPTNPPDASGARPGAIDGDDRASRLDAAGSRPSRRRFLGLLSVGLLLACTRQDDDVLTSSTAGRIDPAVIARTAATAQAVAGLTPRASPAAPSTAGRELPPATELANGRAPTVTSPPAGLAATPGSPAAAAVPTAGGAASAVPERGTLRPAASPTPVPRPTVALAPTASPTAGVVFARGRAIVYAAIGASDTTGVGAPSPERDGWVPKLFRRLPAGSTLVNLGASGALMRDAVAKQLPRALEARPHLVTIWNVVNDLNANVDLVAYERDLDRLLASLIGQTPAQVLIGNCPDLARVPAYLNAGIPADMLRREVLKWNGAIQRAVARQPSRVYIVDLYARSDEIDTDPAMVAVDDFHPSARGYTRLAEIFWEFMVANHLIAAA